MTPEAKVKAKVHTLLKNASAYAVNYIGGAYAANGTPDILACLDGRFIGIEVKAAKGRVSALQLRSLGQIASAGGLALVVYEDHLEYLSACLQDIHNARSNYRLFDRPPAAPYPDGATKAARPKHPQG